MAGVEASFRVSLVITIGALTILQIFFGGSAVALPSAAMGFGEAGWLPHGISGVLRALPFALWVYLGIEQLPLAAEEAHDPVRDMPKGLLLGLATLILFAFLTVILSAGIAPGTTVVGRSDEPLFLGFRTIFGNGTAARLLALIGCLGLAASFHAILFATGRQIYSLSRAGYFPAWLSVTHSTRQTPGRALIAGAVLGYLAACGIYFAGQKSAAGAALLNMAVLGAVLAYILQMLSFLRLRSAFPSLARPYRSPLGRTGAVVSLAIAIATLLALCLNREYRPGILGAALWFLLGTGYFARYGRKKLVLAPEEQFAEEARSAAWARTVIR